MTTTTDMRTLFGGGTAAPKFTGIPGVEGGSVEMPEKGDTLGTLVRKMNALREIVEAGYSLAVATGLKATAHATTNPEEFAMGEMSVTELTQYKAWKAGARLGEFDPQKSREDEKVWTGSEKSLDSWVQGMRMMYGDEKLDRGNARWYAKHAAFLVPTIMAHIKVLRAHNGLTVKDSDLSAAELAEYQTARKILAESGFLVQTKMNELKKLTSQIDAASQAVLARVRYYEPRIKKKPGKTAPINRERGRMSLPLFGGPSNLSALEKRGKAVARESLGMSRAHKRARVGSDFEAGVASPTYVPTSPVLTGLDAVEGGDVSMENL